MKARLHVHVLTHIWASNRRQFNPETQLKPFEFYTDFATVGLYDIGEVKSMGFSIQGGQKLVAWELGGRVYGGGEEDADRREREVGGQGFGMGRRRRKRGLA